MVKSIPTERKVIESEIEVIICNRCGRTIFDKNTDMIKGDCIHVKQAWEYGSKYDGEIHKFDLCEECYDKIRAEFVIPVEVEDTLGNSYDEDIDWYVNEEDRFDPMN